MPVRYIRADLFKPFLVETEDQTTERLRRDLAEAAGTGWAPHEKKEKPDV